MPIYVYRSSEHGCAYCASEFEVFQSMKEQPLEVCPHCGGKVERVIQPVGISTRPSGKALLSDKNLAKHGFKKFVNQGDGTFHRTV